MLRCIRCGACLNACPVYRKIGGHAYGAVYSGPIGALITPMFKGLENYKDLPQASSLCGACHQVCPVRIDIPKLLIALRRKMVTGGLAKRSDRLMMRLWTLSLRSRLTYRLVGWGQRMVFRAAARLNGSLKTGAGADLYAARGWVRKFPGPVGRWTAQRDLPSPPARSFRHWWRRHQQDQK